MKILKEVKVKPASGLRITYNDYMAVIYKPNEERIESNDQGTTVDEKYIFTYTSISLLPVIEGEYDSSEVLQLYLSEDNLAKSLNSARFIRDILTELPNTTFEVEQDGYNVYIFIQIPVEDIQSIGVYAEDL